jgi:rhodanese-related sulfurtransferase
VQIFLDAGYQDVKELKDGFTGWQKAGLPVTAGPALSGIESAVSSRS